MLEQDFIDDQDLPSCMCCCGTDCNPCNRLLVVQGDDDDAIKHVHLACAAQSSSFGFCWCCGDNKVFFIDALNDANECEDHAGESVPSYPEVDRETYLEYQQKDG